MGDQRKSKKIKLEHLNNALHDNSIIGDNNNDTSNIYIEEDSNNDASKIIIINELMPDPCQNILTYQEELVELMKVKYINIFIKSTEKFFKDFESKMQYIQMNDTEKQKFLHTLYINDILKLEKYKQEVKIIENQSIDDELLSDLDDF